MPQTHGGEYAPLQPPLTLALSPGVPGARERAGAKLFLAISAARTSPAFASGRSVSFRPQIRGRGRGGGGGGGIFWWLRIQSSLLSKLLDRRSRYRSWPRSRRL